MESIVPSPIEETIAHLANNNKPLLNTKLVDLSNLSPEEVELFEQAWVAIELERQRQIVSRLVELAEDNAQLDFDSIFKDRLNDQDDEVRSKAIEGLWESEDTSLIKPLINLLEQDSSEKVQAAAATALGKFVMLVELKKLRSSYKSKIEHVLLSITNDKSRPVEVRRRALEAVAPLSLPQVKRAITKAYQSHNPKLKISAIYAMGKNCDPSWLAILLRELTSADTEIRYEVCGACGELGEEEAIPYLIELVNDPDIEVQLAAIQALGKIGGTEAEECFKECLNNPSELVQQTAEQALDELGLGEDPLPFEFKTFES
jgi:HEAT repeat protein